MLPLCWRAAFLANKQFALMHNAQLLGRSLQALRSPQLVMQQSTPSSSEQQGSEVSDTSIFASCILERLPVVLPHPPLWEVEYKNWALERQLQQQFFKQYPKKEKRQQTFDSTTAAGDTAIDGLEGSIEKVLSPVPRLTHADTTGNKRTMKRLLDRKLFLLVKNGSGKTAHWRFPEAQHQPGETIRQTAERALQAVIGSERPVQFIGHAPLAHKPSHGSTSFFMLAQVMEDPWEVSLEVTSGSKDYVWVSKEEISEFIEDEELSKLAALML